MNISTLRIASPSFRRGIGLGIGPSIALGAASLLASVHFASAGLKTWDGDGNPTFSWSTGANWDLDTAPVATFDSLNFGGTVGLTNTNDLVTSVTGINFDSTAGAFTLGGNALTITSGASITNGSTSLQTINLNLTNSGVTNIEATSGDIVLGGAISSNSLNVSGPFTVTLGGATSNVNLGATINSGGTLVLAKNGVNAIVGAININSGGTLRLGGATTDQIHFNQTVQMNGSGAAFDMNGRNEEIGKLLGTGGAVTNTSATGAVLTVGGGTNSSDFSNILLQNGTGVLGITTRNVAASTYTMGAANTYTGATNIGGTTNVSSLANGGIASSIGASTNAAANLVIQGTLAYTGGSVTTDRGFTTSR